MTITSIGTYRPVWERGAARVAGPDEDLVTLAVAAARAALVGATTGIDRVVVVVASPDVLDGVGLGVVLRSLGLADSVPIELRIGAAPATVEALLDASDRTLVIAVDLDERSAGAAAAVVSAGSGVELSLVDRRTGSLPMRVRHVGSVAASVYLDSRVERELASAPLLQLLAGDGKAYVAGLVAKDAQKLGAAKSSVTLVGAAAPLFLLAERAEESGTFRLVALDAAIGVGVNVRIRGSLEVSREERRPLPAARRPVDPAPDTEISFSMPAYARAFDAKIGMVAARCECGEVSFPPRLVCLACDRYDETTPVELPREGEIYTAVTVHVPIPGIAGKYAVAIVALDDSPVRVLARVADMEDEQVAIGSRGRLVLRRVAEREGVPDYGYAFQLDTKDVA